MNINLPVAFQLREAVTALAVGIAAGILYDVLRTFRRRIGGCIVTAVCDAIFWLTSALTLFSLGLSVGGGEQRIFVVILASLGALLYFLALSRLVLALFALVADGVEFILSVIMIPVRFLRKILNKYFIFVKKAFSSGMKWYKIKVNQRKKRRDTHKGEPDEDKKSKYIYEAYNTDDNRVRGFVYGSAARKDRERPYRSGGDGSTGGGAERRKRGNGIRHRA